MRFAAFRASSGEKFRRLAALNTELVPEALLANCFGFGARSHVAPLIHRRGKRSQATVSLAAASASFSVAPAFRNRSQVLFLLSLSRRRLCWDGNREDLPILHRGFLLIAFFGIVGFRGVSAIPVFCNRLPQGSEERAARHRAKNWPFQQTYA
jgi:hypothetical protein